MTNQTTTRKIYRVIIGWYNYAEQQAYCLVERGTLNEHLQFEQLAGHTYRLTPSSARRIAALKIASGWPY
jgi:hypothetical protein